MALAAAVLTAGLQRLAVPPNIALILIDDYGWNDIGYNNANNSNDIRTPVMDDLSARGVRLR